MRREGGAIVVAAWEEFTRVLSAVVLSWTLGLAAPGQAWAISPNAGGPYSVAAGQSVTMDGSGTWMSLECLASLLSPLSRPAPGIQFRWDQLGDGAYETGWSDAPTWSFSAAGLDGPTVVPVVMGARCYALSGWPPYDATDWYADEGTARVNVTVSNVAPTIGAITVLDGRNPSALPEADLIRFQVAYADVETQDTHTFRWEWSDGSVTTGNPTSRRFGVGAASVTVTVTDDDGGSASTTGSYGVTNSAPVLTSVLVPSSANEGALVEFVASATDGGGSLSYTWTVSDGTVLQGSTVRWLAAQDGQYEVDLEVSDGSLSATASATLAVVNLAPVIARLTRPSTPSEGVSVTLSAEASDAGDDPITYAWQVPGAQRIGPGNSASTTWTFPDDGTYTVTVTATDDAGAHSSLVEQIVVDNLPPAPVSVSVPTAAEEGAPVQFSAVFSDVAADPLVYAWTFDGGVPELGGSVTRTFSDGAVAVGLRVSDGDGGEWTGSWVLTVADLPPSVAELVVPSSVMEGETAQFSVIASDAGGDQTTVSWDFGDGSTASGAAASHVYAQDGSYEGTVTVDDGSAPVVVPFVVAVHNAAPTLNVSLPGTAEEGAPVLITASASDPGVQDVLTLSWYVDGELIGHGASFAATFDDDGAHTIAVEVSDVDGGSDEAERVLLVHNVAPTAQLTGSLNDAAGQPLIWQVQITDPGADTFRVDWSFGDGATTTDGGLSQQHTYLSNGARTVRVTVTDDDGGVGVATLPIEITLLGPRFTAFVVPEATEEGRQLTMGCEGVDGGNTGTLSTVWSFGDGATGAGSSAAHAWADDGDYEVRCTLTDGQSRSEVRSATVHVANVAPVVQGSPAVVVEELAAYQFQPGVLDPGSADTHTWTLIGGPSGAVVSPSTGRVDWPVPGGSYVAQSFTLQVRDDDGGVGTRSWSVQVNPRDDDDDGMSDFWEIENGLDPADATDADEDPDGDGRSNLDEYVGDTDPRSDDRPGAPVLVSPIGGAQVATTRPTLALSAASSPAGDALVYDIAVYTALDPVTPIWQRTDLSAGAQLAVVVGLNLTENAGYSWTARASDGYADGPWAAREDFVVNAVEEAPSRPNLSWPSDGATVATTSPTLQVLPSSDPDGDTLSYEIAVFTAQAVQIRLGTELEQQGEVVEWAVDPEIPDGAELCWQAVAIDDVGLRSEPSELWCFQVDLANLPPSSPVFLRPTDGGVLNDRAAVLLIEDGIDPEARPTFLRIELDRSPSFGSPDLLRYQRSTPAAGPTSWAPGLLDEDTWYYARALTTDGAAESAWTRVSFFVNEANDPPGEVVLVSPADEERTRETPVLVVLAPDDPEGLPVTLSFEVRDTADLLVDSAQGVQVLDGGAEFKPVTLPAGLYRWRARGVDSQGLAGPWSEEWTFSVASASELPNSRVVPERPGGTVEDLLLGCACDQRGPVGSVGWLLIGVVALRRRR